MAGFLKRLFGRGKPAGPPPPPRVSDSLNVFAGNFASELAATDYAMGLADHTLAADLGGVGIGPDDVEIIFGAERIAAASTYLHFTGPRKPLRDADTLLLLTDRGYDVTALSDARVRFVGMCTVS